MTTNFIRGFLVILFVSTLLVSCEKTTNVVSQPEETSAPTRTMTVLGRKLPNPYSPENVKLAWENLKKSNPDVTKGISMDFASTHVYVKFAPKDGNELKQLKNTYGIDLDDTPAFYEYEKEGDYYHDPSIDKDMPTYQYATLAVGTKLPNTIKHEVLEQLLLLSRTEKENNKLKYSEAFYEALLYESYSITKMTKLIYGTNLRRDRWRPSGELKKRFYYTNGDNLTVDFPDVGVKVKMVTPVGIIINDTEMYSGSDGKFVCPSNIAGAAKYRVYYTSDVRYTSGRRDGSELRLRRLFVDGRFIIGSYTHY